MHPMVTERRVLQSLAALLMMMGAPWAAAQVYYSKTEVITYHDNLNKWVLGQVASVVTSGVPTSHTDYDAVTALPLREFQYSSAVPGKSYTWTTTGAEAGTLKTLTDGIGNVTTFSDWKRGIPRQILYPATPDQPSGALTSATVDDFGDILSVTDEADFKTQYEYDPMGRLAKITYPNGNGDSWNVTTMSFAPSPSAAYGLPANHWRLRSQTGNAVTETLYDALWRPVVAQSYVLGNENNTISQTITRYDGSGRASFASYPQRTLDPAVTSTWADPTKTPIALGTKTTYDALDRVLTIKQDAENNSVLTTTNRYLAGFQTETEDPRGAKTTIGFQVWDQPSTDLPVWINAPEGQVTTIERNVFGRARVIRRGTAAGVLLERRNVYNGNQQVCKTIEPETGSTVMHYDPAGNVDWSAAGLALPSTTACDDTDGAIAARKVSRGYDQRNRLKSLTFPDGNGNQTWAYTPDSQPSQIVTYNILAPGAAAKQVVNTYVYNTRRMVKAESTALEGWWVFNLGYGYDANGSLASQSYPSGQNVSYAPNALGQPTSISSPGQTYADGIKYYANGAVDSFTYGNGVAYKMTQNARQLPLQVDSVGIQRYEYKYDENGNPLTIFDQTREPQTNTYSRVMEYDGLNRLKAAGSASFGANHWHRFEYDPLDNLTSWTLLGQGGRNFYYNYQAGTNRLESITAGLGGDTIKGFGFDAQGNVANSSGQLSSFDYGNRLRAASFGTAMQERYRYDGYGRRVLASSIAGPSNQLGVIFSQYSKSGQLMYQKNDRPAVAKDIDQIYLSGSLVAQRETPSGGGAATIKYQHTDALGSPVAVTNSAGTVLERTAYEPYGGVIVGATKDGPGYTGHVFDLTTKLNYMQQRYYDPSIGRFLSVDPVAARPTGDNFNRYWYANNNPYKFIDPDGRETGAAFRSIYLADSGQSPQGQEAGPIGEVIGDAIIAGAIDMALGGPTGEAAAIFTGIRGARMADKAADVARASKVEKSVKTERIGKFTKTTEVRPGKGPGQSRAEYVRYKNEKGETVRTRKDSYDRAGNFQGRKPLTGGPEGRPAPPPPPPPPKERL